MLHNMGHYGLRAILDSYRVCVCLYKYRVIVLIASRTERKLFQSMVCGTLFVFCPSLCQIFMPQNCVRSRCRIVVLLFVEFSYMHKSFSCLPNAVYIQCIDKCMLWNLEFEFILWFVVQRNEFPVGCRAANNRAKQQQPAKKRTSLCLIWLYTVYSMPNKEICDLFLSIVQWLWDFNMYDLKSQIRDLNRYISFCTCVLTCMPACVCVWVWESLFPLTTIVEIMFTIWPAFVSNIISILHIQFSRLKSPAKQCTPRKQLPTGLLVWAAI